MPASGGTRSLIHGRAVFDTGSNMRISHKIAILMGLTVFITSLIFSFGIYVEKKDALLGGIDKKLYTAALLAREVLGETYHDRIKDRDSVTESDYLSSARRNKRLCGQLGLRSLWSLMERGDDVVFTSSTAVRRGGSGKAHPDFFDRHKNPGIYRKVFAEMPPLYRINPNRWGDVRAVLIPFEDASGRKYLFAASMGTADVNALIMKTLGRSLLVSLMILSAATAIAVFLVADKISRPIVRLTRTAEAVAAGELETRIPLAGSKEIRSLASSFNRMNGAVKEQMRAMEQSRENLSITLNSIGDAVITTDASGRVTRMNPVAERLTARSLRECMGSPLEEVLRLVDTASGTPVGPPLERLIGENTSVALPSGVSLLKRGGAGRQIEACFSPIRDTEKAVVGMVIVFRDVTERKATEKEMRGLRNYLNNIVDSMPSMLVGVDGKGIVTLWNRETEKTTGTPAEKAVGLPLETVFPFKGIDRGRMEQTMEEGTPRREGRFSISEDDVTRYFDATLYPLVEGDGRGVVIRMDDVTESTRINELLVQSEKMLSVGGLAAGMAHEINNPLGVVMASAQSLARRFSPDLKKNRAVASETGIDLDKVRSYMEKRDITEYIEAIARAGERAADIVRNMLEFNRKSKPVRALHELHELMNRAVEMASRDYDLVNRYGIEEIRIKREYDSNLPPMWLIETEVEQVFLNLIKNAAQAMAEKRYEGERPLMVLRAVREGLSVRIEFEDNGPGMEENVRKRIFEPFFSTREVGTGTGLGLSVSYFIITQNHRGQFSVESEPGRGTRFIIHLPIENRAS